MRLQHPPAEPTDTLAAATHLDPYPYYARLAAERPFHRDASLAIWVASSAAAVAEVLGHPACRVRPAAEPVPAALQGTSAGAVFGHFVRMTDGAGHCPLKSAVSAALAMVDDAAITSAADHCAEMLAATIDAASDPAECMRFAFALPSYAVGSMLGLDDDVLACVAADVGDLVRGLAPGASADRVDAASAAADALRERLRAVVTRSPGAADGLLHTLLDGVRAIGGSVDVAIDNAIGLMFQAHDGTAGLIGNALVALARDPARAHEVASRPARARELIDSVLRLDPPVQNTRRFVGAACSIAGHDVAAGDVVLVLLAAANRDRAPGDDSGAGLAFGAGAHACPGSNIAGTIASAGVARLLANGVDPARIDPHPAYRPSVNCRIPVLTRRVLSADRGVESTSQPIESADHVAAERAR
jgi:cytochrome P450